ncbi:hypothetical protein ABRP29_07860 [Pseudomonas sp. WHRI 8822A]|uniref:hypothetical protein n=1 Tax=Pseudomonas sp. WHRI 8822A TaxID=3162568 RepID=UPI0028B202C8|nr:hypothetical protein [Pseudomonas sp.]
MKMRIAVSLTEEHLPVGEKYGVLRLIQAEAWTSPVTAAFNARRYKACRRAATLLQDVEANLCTAGARPMSHSMLLPVRHGNRPA